MTNSSAADRVSYCRTWEPGSLTSSFGLLGGVLAELYTKAPLTVHVLIGAAAFLLLVCTCLPVLVTACCMCRRRGRCGCYWCPPAHMHVSALEMMPMSGEHDDDARVTLDDSSSVSSDSSAETGHHRPRAVPPLYVSQSPRRADKFDTFNPVTGPRSVETVVRPFTPRSGQKHSL